MLITKTDTDTVQIHLGPTAFLNEKKVEIRKGDDTWMLRDAAGQPLRSSVPTEPRGFWTPKKVLLTVVVVKVVLLATVLRH